MEKIPEEANEFITTGFQEMRVDDVEQLAENALEAILDIVEEVFEHFFCAATLVEQGGIRTFVLDAMENFILDQLQKTMLGELIDKHVKTYFRSGKVAEALGMRTLRN